MITKNFFKPTIPKTSSVKSPWKYFTGISRRGIILINPETWL